MRQVFKLAAAVRADQGKGASRRLRRAEKVPGIVYGADIAPQNVMVNHNELVKLLANDSFYTSIIELDFGDKKEQVILRDLQRHPYKPSILHFDLQRVSDREKITMRIPLRFFGGEVCPGVKVSGGMVSRLMVDVEVQCLPKDLPDAIDVDLSRLELNQMVYLSNLALPEGVEFVSLVHGDDKAVATVAKLKDSTTDDSSAAPSAAEVEVIGKGGSAAADSAADK